jgi:hypothetical protein
MAALTRRYVVMPLATEAPFDPGDPDGPFVLKPWKDPAALRALRAYRDNCFPELRSDLDAWIRAIEAGPALRGDVGRRNEAHLQPASRGRAPSSAARGRRASPKATSSTRKKRATKRAR